MSGKKKSVKKKVSKLTSKTKKSMKNIRLEDTVLLRKKSKELLSQIEIDLDVIKNKKNLLNEQLLSLNVKEIKALGAQAILNILLEDKK